jgi:hypothetical protein
MPGRARPGGHRHRGSRGIGRAVAERLAADGTAVVVGYLSD